jgi:4a-hydroxytetrahydrobiopterin dehydratase
MEIDEKTCRQHETGALSSDRVTELLREAPEWSFKDKAIEREFQFKDFKEAMEFVNKVASLSESEAHHPDISISYNKVRLILSTHKVSALSCKDFILAAEIDRLV